MNAPSTLLADRYRLGRQIGRGGMAQVHEGFDERLARPIAIKLLLPEFSTDPGMRLRFEAEARSAACIVHPNVVTVFDSGEDENDGTPFIVMELLPGETLADRMAGGPLDQEWLRRMALDVLGALESAHTAGVIHRDIKPANILIGADDRAKVADFGIAKALQEAPSELTVANQVLGTPAYMAPERIEGQPASTQSDLYAFGVVLYEALTGAKPFAGNTPLTVAYAVCHTEPEPLEEVRPDVDATLLAVVKRAMDRVPNQRFATAAQMSAALEPVDDGDDNGSPPTVIGGLPTADSTVAMPISPLVEGGTVALAPRRGWAGGGLLASAVSRRTWWLAAFVVGLILLAAVLSIAGSDSTGGPGTGVVTTAPVVATTTTTTTTAPPPTTAPPVVERRGHRKGKD